MQEMEPNPVEAPPYLGRPLVLHAFRGLTMTPRRVGAPASVKLLARPYRDPVTRLAAWERSGQVRGDGAPAVYLHEYTVRGLSVRGLVGALDLTHRAQSRAESAVVPHEGGIHPRWSTAAERMQELQLQPAPILLVHRGPEAVRRGRAANRRDPGRPVLHRPVPAAPPAVGTAAARHRRRSLAGHWPTHGR